MGLAPEPLSDLENWSDHQFEAIIFFGFQILVVRYAAGDVVTDSDELL